MWARPRELPERREQPAVRAPVLPQERQQVSRKTNPLEPVVAPGFAHWP